MTQTIIIDSHYEGPWGIWDSMDKCWIGEPDEDGPKVCVAKLEARFIATLMNEQFHHSVRFLIKPIDVGPFRFKDSMTAKKTRGEAMEDIISRTKQT